MRFDIPPEQIAQAKAPHELFLVNLIGNHILMSVALGGVAGSAPWALALIPIVSFSIIGFTLWRTSVSGARDSWYVMAHWQLCARRSRILLAVLGLLMSVVILGWLAHSQAGLMKEAVWAMVGGIGILPVMVTVLVLVLIESDALHQAQQGHLPDWLVARLPDSGPQPLPE